MRNVLVAALGLVAVTALAAEARGRPDKAAEVVAVGVPAALAAWAVALCYGLVLARRIAADAERTIALSSRPEHTRERVLAVLKKRR